MGDGYGLGLKEQVELRLLHRQKIRHRPQLQQKVRQQKVCPIQTRSPVAHPQPLRHPQKGRKTEITQNIAAQKVRRVAQGEVEAGGVGGLAGVGQKLMHCSNVILWMAYNMN